MIGYTLLIVAAVVVVVALALTLLRHRGARPTGTAGPEKPVMRTEPATDEPSPEPIGTVNPSNPSVDRRLPPA